MMVAGLQDKQEKENGFIKTIPREIFLQNNPWWTKKYVKKTKMVEDA